MILFTLTGCRTFNYTYERFDAANNRVEYAKIMYAGPVGNSQTNDLTAMFPGGGTLSFEKTSVNMDQVMKTMENITPELLDLLAVFADYNVMKAERQP